MARSAKPLAGGRPPRPPHRVVAQWEKDFCASCSVPWSKVIEAKDHLYCSYDAARRIADWDDSAALDALRCAKARYWSKINGLERDIPLPDPDMYTGEVDSEAVIDPEVIADFEKDPHVKAFDWNEENYVYAPVIELKDIVPSGWDD